MDRIYTATAFSEEEINEVIDKMGDRWIIESEHEISTGYHVKIVSRNCRFCCAFFNASLFNGDKEQTKQEAIKFRDKIIRTYKLIPFEYATNLPARSYSHTGNISGEVGVRLSLSRNKHCSSVYASWSATLEEGVETFGIEKFGYVDAYMKAMKKRFDYIRKSYDEIPEPPGKETVMKYLEQKLGSKWRSKVPRFNSWFPKKPTVNANEKSEQNLEALASAS